MENEFTLTWFSTQEKEESNKNKKMNILAEGQFVWRASAQELFSI